ncbi:nitroreductase [Acinetobacter wanghuae]|uniref:Putative NAD(P)H nitroreductase n=1 Tax=Acinetobacter wanghuae TaxID=2662362 RepID=A0A5Q0P0Y5_9GAMM|nr:nitroreductase family protein [Acinetobacter wanghuae]MQW92926.1 nitroreductase [Acinetobacter wanghuae]QGA10817.1 nitroreductase [Acinetobacter wanghuae]
MMESVVDIVHQNMHQRQSIGHLLQPAPNTEQLELAFQAALTAPDHHRLKPTKFVVISPEQREAFGELLSQALVDLGETEIAQIERVKNHPLRAPLLVLALTTLQDHPKVPHFEQILSSGAAIQNFILSLQVQGFSTIWRSGAVVKSVLLKEALGITAHDLVSGIIYIGTAAKAIAPRAEIDAQQYVSHWHEHHEVNVRSSEQ